MYLFVFCFLVHQMSETFLPIFSKRTRFPNHAYVSLMVEKKNVWHVLDWLNLLFKGCYMSNLLFSSTNYKQVKHLLASSFWVNGCPSCLVWWNLPSTSYERPLQTCVKFYQKTLQPKSMIIMKNIIQAGKFFSTWESYK